MNHATDLPADVHILDLVYSMMLARVRAMLWLECCTVRSMKNNRKSRVACVRTFCDTAYRKRRMRVGKKMGHICVFEWLSHIPCTHYKRRVVTVVWQLITGEKGSSLMFLYSTNFGVDWTMWTVTTKCRFVCWERARYSQSTIVEHKYRGKRRKA